MGNPIDWKEPIKKIARTKHYDLKDYSGEFIPDLVPQDFSKDMLAKMVLMYQKDYYAIDGFWHTLVRNKYGLDVANSLEKEIWLWDTPRSRGPGLNGELALKRTKELFNIKGDDMASMFKFIQVTIVFGFLYPAQIEWIEYNKHATLTIPRCVSLEYMERGPDPEKMVNFICHEIDGYWWAKLARMWNPKISAHFIKIPPRRPEEMRPDVPCCVCEYILED